MSVNIYDDRIDQSHRLSAQLRAEWEMDLAPEQRNVQTITMGEM